MGMMALPNIIALFFLTKDVVEVYNDYKYKEKNGLELTYDYNITINPDKKTLGWNWLNGFFVANKSFL